MDTISLSQTLGLVSGLSLSLCVLKSVYFYKWGINMLSGQAWLVAELVKVEERKVILRECLVEWGRSPGPEVCG